MMHNNNQGVMLQQPNGCYGVQQPQPPPPPMMMEQPLQQHHEMTMMNNGQYGMHQHHQQPHQQPMQPYQQYPPQPAPQQQQQMQRHYHQNQQPRMYPTPINQQQVVPGRAAAAVCGLCRRDLLLESGEEAVMCCESSCNFVWFHRNCVGMTPDAYHLIKGEPFAEWVCDSCSQAKRVAPIKFRS